MLNLLNMENLHFFCLSHFSFVTADLSLFLSLIFRSLFLSACVRVFFFRFFSFRYRKCGRLLQRVCTGRDTHTVEYVCMYIYIYIYV